MAETARKRKASQRIEPSIEQRVEPSVRRSESEDAINDPDSFFEYESRDDHQHTVSQAPLRQNRKSRSRKASRQTSPVEEKPRDTMYRAGCADTDAEEGQGFVLRDSDTEAVAKDASTPMSEERTTRSSLFRRRRRKNRSEHLEDGDPKKPKTEDISTSSDEFFGDSHTHTERESARFQEDEFDDVNEINTEHVDPDIDLDGESGYLLRNILIAVATIPFVFILVLIVATFVFGTPDSGGPAGAAARRAAAMAAEAAAEAAEKSARNDAQVASPIANAKTRSNGSPVLASAKLEGFEIRLPVDGMVTSVGLDGERLALLVNQEETQTVVIYHVAKGSILAALPVHADGQRIASTESFGPRKEEARAPENSLDIPENNVDRLIKTLTDDNVPIAPRLKPSQAAQPGGLPMSPASLSANDPIPFLFTPRIGVNSVLKIPDER
ncbi:MAG: hypothetical protein AAF720_10825 [Pseudomonadota bacterium]